MKFRKNLGALLPLLLVGGGLTAANMVWNRPRPEGNALSRFEVGNPLPPFALNRLSAAGAPSGSEALPSGCRLLVLFSVTCPHCHSAAARDAEIPDGVPNLPVVWISETDDAAATEFARLVRAPSTVRYGGDAPFKKLKVTGIPSAFLISADNIVLWAGGYSGGESNHTALLKRCEA